jgi:hypothetical protein
VNSRLDITGNISLFQKHIAGRTVAICLQGKSIETLEQRIDDFKGLNICWAGQTQYDIIQENILNKINESLDIVLDIAEVKYKDEYDKFIRLPNAEKFLHKNSLGLILTQVDIFNNLKKIQDCLCINPQLNCIFIDVKGSNLSIPNSLTLYLLLLTQYGARQIILFGCDGFGKPSEFRKYQNKSDLHTYYYPETAIKSRRIGFGTDTMSALYSDSFKFNEQFPNLYSKYCRDYQIRPVKIYNCNSNSMLTLFETISYDTAVKLCQI